jgi:hypothetical protein
MMQGDGQDSYVLLRSVTCSWQLAAWAQATASTCITVYFTQLHAGRLACMDSPLGVPGELERALLVKHCMKV